MPAALEVDWEAIQQDYKSGLSLDALADKYQIKRDTIYARAHRGGWKSVTAIARAQAQAAAKTAIRQHLSQAIAEAKPALEAAVAECVEEAKTTARKLVRQVSIHLDNPVEPDDLQKLAGALDRGVGVWRKSLGMDDQAQNNALTVMVGVGVIRPDGSIGIQRGECVPGDYGQDAASLTLEAELVTKPPV